MWRKMISPTDIRYWKKSGAEAILISYFAVLLPCPLPFSSLPITWYQAAHGLTSIEDAPKVETYGCRKDHSGHCRTPGCFRRGDGRTHGNAAQNRRADRQTDFGDRREDRQTDFGNRRADRQTDYGVRRAERQANFGNRRADRQTDYGVRRADRQANFGNR